MRPTLFDLARGKPALLDKRHARRLPTPSSTADPDFRAALHAYMLRAVDEVLAHPEPDAVVAGGKAMLRWGWDGLEPTAGAT